MWVAPGGRNGPAFSLGRKLEAGGHAVLQDPGPDEVASQEPQVPGRFPAERSRRGFHRFFHADGQMPENVSERPVSGGRGPGADEELGVGKHLVEGGVLDDPASGSCSVHEGKPQGSLSTRDSVPSTEYPVLGRGQAVLSIRG